MSAPRTAQRATITARVRAAGHDLTNLETWDLPADSFTPAQVEGVDGTVITGILVSGEIGTHDLRTALTGADRRRFQMTQHSGRYAAVFADAPAIALSRHALSDVLPEWGDSLSPRGNDHAPYVENYARQLPYTQGHDAGADLHWKPMKDLRAIAREVGLSPQPARKADLIAALQRHDGFLAKYGGPQRPECYPAFQRYTATLVLRADAGAARLVIEALAEAIEHGTLGIGDPTRPFSHVGFFYDTRDETPAIVAEREAQFDWDDARMEELKPVADALKAKGHSWYALRRPTVIAPDDRPRGVYYWLNGSSGYRTTDGIRVHQQPHGWYSLEELAAEKFLTEENSAKPGATP